MAVQCESLSQQLESVLEEITEPGEHLRPVERKV
jgi:hypothetical protein